jgi:hypothetical protein
MHVCKSIQLTATLQSHPQKNRLCANPRFLSLSVNWAGRSNQEYIDQLSEPGAARIDKPVPQRAADFSYWLKKQKKSK